MLLAFVVVAAGDSLAEAAPEPPAPPAVAAPGRPAAATPRRDASPSAMQQRASTRLAHADESPAQAIATLTSELPELTSAPPWQPLNLPSGFSVRGFSDGDRDATVQAPDGKSLALTSTAPLRAVDPDTGTLGPVDLQPVARGDGFGPANGLTPVQLPGDITQGIAVGGLKLGFPGATAAGAQPVAGTVVWPNSLPDTDVVAQPTVQGLELSLALRSTDSPEQFPLSLDLPVGATVRPATTDADRGGLEVIGQDGAVIATISAPVAWDAEKVAVATSWALDGQTPTLRVEHVGKDVAYPVAVDPVVNDNRYGADLAARPWSFAPGPSMSAFYGDAGWGPGMYQRLTTSQFYDNGWQSYWYLDLGGRTASVRQVHGEAMNHDTGTNVLGGPDTCTYLALNSAGTRTDLSDVWCDTYRNRSTNAGSWQVPHAAGNWAQVSVFANGAGTRGYFQQFVGVLVAALSDDDLPTGVSLTPSSSSWGTSATVSASASDSGLGVKSFAFSSPDTPTWTGTSQAQPCIVICNTWAGSTAASVTGLPDGQRTVQVNASDPTGNQAAAVTSVRLDRAAPSIDSLTGTLYDNRSTAFAGTRAIRVHLSGEGSTAATTDRRSGVKQIRLIVDNGSASPIIADVKNFPQQDSYVPSDVTESSILRIHASQLTPGTHTVNVDVGDWAGNTRLQPAFTITAAADTTAPALTLGGELYELRTEPLTSDAYDFDVEADDLDPTGTGTGTKDIAIAVDGATVASTTNPCTSNYDSACDSDLAYTFLRAGRTLGSHTVTVTSHDQANNLRTSSFTVNLAGPASTDPAASEDTSAAGGAGDDDPSTTACNDRGPRPRGSRVVSRIRRATTLQGPETTVRYPDGAYRVARCDARGRLVVGQVVAPVPVPGGGTAMLVTEEFRPDPDDPSQTLTDYIDYAAPTDPDVVREWRDHKSKYLDAVIPATPGA